MNNIINVIDVTNTTKIESHKTIEKFRDKFISYLKDNNITCYKVSYISMNNNNRLFLRVSKDILNYHDYDWEDKSEEWVEYYDDCILTFYKLDEDVMVRAYNKLYQVVNLENIREIIE